MFCSTSALQRKLYERIIESKSVRSCLSASAQGSRHFICISALKKLCNHPLLLYNSATEFEENKSLCDDDFEGVGVSQLVFPQNYLILCFLVLLLLFWLQAYCSKWCYNSRTIARTPIRASLVLPAESHSPGSLKAILPPITCILRAYLCDE